MVTYPVFCAHLNLGPVILSTMDGLSLVLVLLSAIAHSSWNLLLKQSDNKEVFVWGILAGGSVMLAPLGGALFYYYPIATPGYGLVIVSAVLQILYLVLLGRGYAQGDLSLVYPIARGIGPMLVPVLAVLMLGERIALPAIIGIAAIVIGIYVVSWWGRFGEIWSNPLGLLKNRGIRYAILTGLTITIYTLVDKRGVEYVQPFLYMYLITLGATIGLTPYVLCRHSLMSIRQEWQKNAWPVLASGLLVFLAYGLVLTAFSLSKVGYVAPAREVGIVAGVLMGVFLLKEQFGFGRLLGSGFIVSGLVLIALSP